MRNNTFSDNYDNIENFVSINKIGSFGSPKDHRFKAKVTYKNNSLDSETIICDVNIVTESDCVLVNIYHDEDSHTYTSSFSTRYQDFKVTSSKNLLIIGEHKSNLDVGKYEVEISFIEDTKNFTK